MISMFKKTCLITKKLWLVSLCGLLVVVCTKCGNDGDGSNNQDDLLDSAVPDTILDPDGDLSEFAVNTFLKNGIDITVDPTILKFDAVTKKKSATKSFSLKNGSKSSHQFKIEFLGSSGGFNIIIDGGSAGTHLQNIAAGSSQTVTVNFEADFLGKRTGLIKITADGLDGYIHLPLWAEFDGPADFKVIDAAFSCANKDATQITKINFGRIASGVKTVRNFKICNTGGKPVKVNFVQLASFKGTGDLLDEVVSNPFDLDSWNWSLEGTLLDPFDYYDPQTSEEFTPPQRVAFAGSLPNPLAAFGVTANQAGKKISPYNLVIDAASSDSEFKSYIVFDVLFEPNLKVEAPEGQIYEPIPIAADVVISTNLGKYVIPVAGATGGLEPHLKIIDTPEGIKADCKNGAVVDLESMGPALHFGVATIYNDWIPEDFKEKRLTLCNVGSGSKPLKVWGAPMMDGFFTYVKKDPEIQFPLAINPGESKELSLQYAPTPKDSVPSTTWDFGQLTLKHNGSNGPYNHIALIGEQNQDLGHIIDVAFDGFALNKQFYEDNPTKRKNLQCLKMKGEAKELTGESTKSFVIQNNSNQLTLNSTITFNGNLREEVIENNEKKDVDLSEDDAKVVISQNSQKVYSVTTEPKKTSNFDLIFTLSNKIKKDTVISGKIEIENKFTNSPNGLSLPDYEINFKATVSESGECTGGGAGVAPDGRAIMIIDRITMNLLTLGDPARNPPAFKFHMPVDLYFKEGRARIGGLKYDPTIDANPVDQIRSYAHQITHDCYPLPTNPYKLEFEPGSWGGSTKDCAVYTSPIDPDKKMVVDPSTACIANNGTQKASLTHEDGTTEEVNVFYHEFVKFASDGCTLEFEGKFSTFFIPEGKTAFDVFSQLKEKKGIGGTEADYAEVTLPFSFNSYIHFYKAIDLPGCTYPAAKTLTAQEDPDAIKACWLAIKSAKEINRSSGIMDECAYFQFEIEEGCIPEDKNDATKPECKDVDINNPKTWKGYGEYEKNPDPDYEDLLYDITLRNVHIRAFTLVHSYADLFPHAGRILFSDLYVTLTTKAVGKEDGDKPWNDLIAEKTIPDFKKEDVARSLNDAKTKDKSFSHWIEDGVNGEMRIGKEDNEFDNVPCVEFNKNFKIADKNNVIILNGGKHCRGNYEIENNTLYHAGEPIHLELKNRLILAGLSAFRGEGQLAPSFARLGPDGRGAPLFFTFHGCFKTPDELAQKDKDGNFVTDNKGNKLIDKTIGCFDYKLDDFEGIDEYVNHGMLTNKDLNPESGKEKDSKAYINFLIYDDDRNRLTDYYNQPSHFKYDSRGDTWIDKKCGEGN